jgi:hypothetical protein
MLIVSGFMLACIECSSFYSHADLAKIRRILYELSINSLIRSAVIKVHIRFPSSNDQFQINLVSIVAIRGPMPAL